MRARGFTLIELVLVLAILGTVAALGVARLGAGIDSDRHAAFARELAATLQQAADRARLAGRRHRVKVEPTASRLSVEEEDDPLDHPDVWSEVQSAWAHRRAFATGVAVPELVLDADAVELAQLVPLADVTELWVEYDPEGVHRVVCEGLELATDDAPLAELVLSGPAGDPPLVVRLEPTGVVRVWTATERAAHFTTLGVTPLGAEGAK